MFMKVCRVSLAKVFSPSHGLSTVSRRTFSSQESDWNTAILETGQIVGYPTSFVSLRSLISDDVSKADFNLKTFHDSNHPVLKFTKNLLSSDRRVVDIRGIIILLISKAATHLTEGMEVDQAAGVLQSQRELAVWTELIRMSHIITRNIVNIYDSKDLDPDVLDDTILGNKVTLLISDRILAQCHAGISAIHHQGAFELICRGQCDLISEEFFGRRDLQNNSLPSRPDPLAVQEMPFNPSAKPRYFSSTPALLDWTERNYLSEGSLLSKSCQAALLLAGHKADLQKQGYKFGKHFALALQARLDLEPFNSSHYTLGTPFNLTSAPVMFHSEHDPSLFDEIDKGTKRVQDVDFAKVHRIVSKGKGIELTKQLLKEHSQKAMEVLDIFPESDARTGLSKIIDTVENL